MLKRLFSKIEKEKISDVVSDITPRGIKTTLMATERNFSPGLSKEEVENLKLESKNEKSKDRVDISFIQEVSDRLYGPESEDYIKALQELNMRFKSREGRFGSQFYDSSIVNEVRKREDTINKSIKNV